MQGEEPGATIWTDLWTGKQFLTGEWPGKAVLKRLLAVGITPLLKFFNIVYFGRIGPKFTSMLSNLFAQTPP